MVEEIENEVETYEDEKTRLYWDDVSAARTFRNAADNQEDLIQVVKEEELKEELKLEQDMKEMNDIDECTTILMKANINR